MVSPVASGSVGSVVEVDSEDAMVISAVAVTERVYRHLNRIESSERLKWKMKYYKVLSSLFDCEILRNKTNFRPIKWFQRLKSKLDLFVEQLWTRYPDSRGDSET